MISCLTLLLGSIVTYIIAKKMTSSDRILNITYDVLDETTQNVEMQKKVYTLGILLGNGIKSGIGLQKGRGKFKMEDLVGMGMQYFFESMRQGQTTTNQPQNNSPRENLLSQ